MGNPNDTTTLAHWKSTSSLVLTFLYGPTRRAFLLNSSTSTVSLGSPLCNDLLDVSPPLYLVVFVPLLQLLDNLWMTLNVLWKWLRALASMYMALNVLWKSHREHHPIVNIITTHRLVVLITHRFVSRHGMTDWVMHQKVYRDLVKDELFFEWLRKQPNSIRQEVHDVVIVQ